MRRSKPRLAVCAVVALTATLAPPAAQAGDQLTIEPTPAEDGLRHMAHAFVAYDGAEFSDFLQTFEFPELADAFIEKVEVDLYNPFKGDVLLAESVALTAQIEYSLSMVFNPYAEDVPNPARSSRALWLGLDGTTELGDANSFSTTLPGLAGSTHPGFRDFASSFGEGLGVPLGGSELAANGNKISSFVSDPGTADTPLSAVYFLGGRTVGRSDDMGCSGTIRDRGIFFRPLEDFKGQERLNWDDSTGANSAVSMTRS